MARLPSSDTTTASSSSSSGYPGDASAPIGVWQPPPSASTTARSALQRRAASGVVDRRDGAARVFVGFADLDGDDALARRRHARRRRKAERDARGEPEAAQAGGREHERIVLAVVELAQPRVQIAADRREQRAGKQPLQLRDPPHAARADDRRVAEQSE